MNRLRRFFHDYSLSIVAGILIGTSYIPFPPWASVFCFVPLWLKWFRLAGLANENHSTDALKSDAISVAKKIAMAGWVAQFIFTLIGFNWVALTVHEFGFFPWPLAILTLLLFCAVANLDVPITGIVWFYLQRKFRLSPRKSLILLGLITALCEAWVPTLFPWNYGYTWLWVQAPMAQMAELIGFQGLSALVILLNCASFLAWQAWRRREPVRRPLAVLLGSLLVLNLAGWGLKKSLTTPDRELRTLLVQANIGNMQKHYAEKGWGFRQFISDRYTLVASEGLLKNDSTQKPVDFMVWPETAYPYDIDQRLWSQESRPPVYPPPAKRLIDFAQQMQTDLITGGYGYAPRDGKVTNTFFIFEKSNGEQPGRVQPHPYYKTILLPFGEFIPGADLYPKIRQWVPAGDFSFGPGPQIQKLGELRIGPQICYESLFPGFSNALARLGAQVFVNLTNDSWYGTWQEPYQHLYMTLGRAVEFRRPLIRATNTGISTVVLASGEVLEKSPMMVEWSGLYTVPYVSNPEPTLYQLYPWLIDVLLLGMVGFVLLRGILERPRQPRLE